LATFREARRIVVEYSNFAPVVHVGLEYLFLREKNGDRHPAGVVAVSVVSGINDLSQSMALSLLMDPR